MDLSAINWFDVVLGGIIILSTLIGMARGLVRELLSMVAWVVSLWLAYRFAGSIAEAYVMQVVSDRSISYMLAFGLLFFVALFCFGLLNLVFAQLFARTGLGGIDVLFGLIFGLARGILFAALLVFCLRYTTFVEHSSWKQSYLQPSLSRLVQWGTMQLEPKIRELLIYEKGQKQSASPQQNESVEQHEQHLSEPVLKLESTQ